MSKTKEHSITEDERPFLLRAKSNGQWDWWALIECKWQMVRKGHSCWQYSSHIWEEIDYEKTHPVIISSYKLRVLPLEPGLNPGDTREIGGVLHKFLNYSDGWERVL